MTDVPFAILQFLVDHPEVVWVYLAAMLVAVALRAAYPETEARPRWIRALLAVVDLLQLNLSGPAKLFVNAKKPDAPGDPKP